MELNPNHPVTQSVSDHWHKIAAVLMHKLGYKHVVITLQDLRDMPADSAISIQELKDGIHLRIINTEEAQRLARQHGGLPT